LKNGTYNLHAQFDRAINYADRDGFMVSLVKPDIGSGPGNIVLPDLPTPAPPHIVVEHDRVVIGTLIIERSQLPSYNPRLSVTRPPTADELDRRVRLLLTLFPPGSPAFLFDSHRADDVRTDFERAYRDQFQKGAQALENGNYKEGARLLKGLGFGLTPAGDDFLCGFLWALTLAGPNLASVKKIIYESARGNNLIANHFLRAAYEGLFFEHFKNFTRALCEGYDDELRQSFVKLLTIGATSGADTAVGFILGLTQGRLRHVAAAQTPNPPAGK